MSKFWVLLKLQLLEQFAAIRPKNLKADFQQNRGKSSLRALGILVLILWVAGSLGYAEWKMLDVMIRIHMPQLMLGIAILISMATTLLYGIFYVMTVLYYARDTSLLAALPIREWELYSARMARIWMGEAGLTALFVLPPVVLYMVRLGFDAGMLARGILVTLFAPVLPLCIAGLLCSVLTRLSGFRKHREMFTTVCSIVMIVLVMMFSAQMGSFSSGSMDDSAYLMKLMADNSALMNRLTGYFPPAQWAANGLMGNVGQLLLFLGVSIAGAALTVLVCSRGYLRVASMAEEGAASGKKLNLASAGYRQRSSLRSLMQREMREAVRTPAYLTNCVLSSLMMPLLMVIVMGMSMSKVPELTQNGDLLSAVRIFIRDFRHGIGMSIIGAGLTGLMGFMCGMSAVCSTSISREGKHHILYRMLPVPTIRLLRAKALSGFAFAALGYLVPCALLVIILPELWPAALEALVWTLMLSASFSMIGVVIDAMHPRLNWSTELQAVKQNFNMVTAMLIGFAVIAVLAGGSYLLIGVLDCSQQVFIASITGFLILLCAGSDLLLRKVGVPKYLQIE